MGAVVLWGVSEMLNVAVTSLIDAVALKILLLTQWQISSLQTNKFPSTQRSV